MNILLVDDSDFSLSLTKELILGTKIKEDINFILAKDGEEAVRIFEESKSGEISVIFMDVVMPEKSGLTALKESRSMEHEDAATIPIVIVSALAESNCVDETNKGLITDYIQKPLSVAKFQDSFLKILE